MLIDDDEIQIYSKKVFLFCVENHQFEKKNLKEEIERCCCVFDFFLLSSKIIKKKRKKEK